MQGSKAYELSSGFTLLEVLVSIAITAIILTSLYSGFFISKKAVDSLDDDLVRLQEMRMSLDMMRREIESAFFSWEKPYTFFRIEGREIYGMDTSSIAFTTFSPFKPGLLAVSYFTEKKGTTLVLKKDSGFKIGGSVSEIQSNRVENKGKDDKSVEVLENIESFSVEARYRGEWIKTWDSNLSHEAPEEVRLTIVTYVNGKRYTLTELARIRTGRLL